MQSTFVLGSGAGGEWNRDIAIASLRARTCSLNSFLFRTAPISFTKSFIPSTSIFFYYWLAFFGLFLILLVLYEVQPYVLEMPSAEGQARRHAVSAAASLQVLT